MAADITEIILAFNRANGTRDEIVHVVIPDDGNQDQVSIRDTTVWAEHLGEVLKQDLIKYVTDIARVK
jgi:hypothetical protein